MTTVCSFIPRACGGWRVIMYSTEAVSQLWQYMFRFGSVNSTCIKMQTSQSSQSDEWPRAQKKHLLRQRLLKKGKKQNLGGIGWCWIVLNQWNIMEIWLVQLILLILCILWRSGFTSNHEPVLQDSPRHRNMGKSRERIVGWSLVVVIFSSLLKVSQKVVM